MGYGAASSSPYVVPLPWSVAANVDPEESFIASLSSCHMLTFIWLAGKAGFLVESYRDEATGVMAKNERGSFWVSKVTLHPQIVWGGEKRRVPRSSINCTIAPTRNASSRTR